MAYDYEKEMKKDIMKWLKANPDYVKEYADDVTDREEVEETLYDALWLADSVTGNKSGKYDTDKSKKRVLENLGLACSALKSFGDSLEHLGIAIDKENFDYLDVSIRCFLLSGVLNDILDIAEKGGCDLCNLGALEL